MWRIAAAAAPHGPLQLAAAILLCLGAAILQYSSTLSVAQYSTEGFVSIDCGSSETSTYKDASGITWTPDALRWPEITAVSESRNVPSTTFLSSGQRQYGTVRYFPTTKMKAPKFCYSLEASGGSYYLLRAAFWSGGGLFPYTTLRDGVVRFSVIVDTYLVQEVVIALPQSDVWVEEMYVRAEASFVTLCLSAASTTSDVPFINSIELRPLGSNDSLTLVSLVKATGSPVRLIDRQDFGAAAASSSGVIRFPDDKYDRVWYKFGSELQQSTSATIDLGEYADDNPPQIVIQTVLVARSFNYTITPSATTLSTPLTAKAAAGGQQQRRYYISLLFCEINKEAVTSAGKRVFNASVAVGSSPPVISETVDIFQSVAAAAKLFELRTGKPAASAQLPLASGNFNIALVTLPNSTVTATISAAEILQIVDTPMLAPTASSDVVAIQDISALLSFKSFIGDPCLPLNYSYPWIKCNTNQKPPKVTSISLSDYGLAGSVPASINNLDAVTEIYLDQNALGGALPTDFSKLLQLQKLNLSNNFLNGSIPASIASLPKLTYLNIANNNFSGTIPQALLTKQGLTFLYGGNKLLCQADDQASCQVTPTPTISPKKKTNIGLILGIAVSVAFAGIVALIAAAIYICRRSSRALEPGSVPEVDNVPAQAFTVVQIVNLTNNMSENIKDQGSFGREVYKGDQNGLPVAVKMLPSPVGEAEFQNVVSLLDHVRHNKLVRFVGYCVGENQMLVYELMPNGSLHDALHGSNGRTLTWEERLRIVLNVAQALAYLHGQEPQVIHGDVSSKNVLLSDNEAKLADFGLNNLRDQQVIHGDGDVDPEAAQPASNLVENDINGFGVVLLEVICGRLENEGLGIVDWVVRERERVSRIVDRRLEGRYDEASMKKLVKIALACVTRPPKVPTMTRVCDEISRIRR